MIKQLTITLTIITSFFMCPSQAYDQRWEYQQKAKIVEYLLQEITWPKAVINNNMLNICLFGEVEDPRPLAELAGKTIQSCMVTVAKISDPYQNRQNCHLIYIAKSKNDELLKLIKAYNHKAVLLLAESDSFAKNGGTMNFVILNDQFVGLTINQQTLKDAALTFRMKGINNITIMPDQKDLPKSH